MDDPGSSDGRPRPSSLRLVLAGAMVLAGTIWILQGLGILTAARSFMVGDPTWTVIGVVAVGAGGLLAWRSVHR